MASTDLTRLFEEAQDLHQAGRLADAKARYERVLAVQPAHGPTLHMLGLMAYQVGQNDVAVDLMRKAAARDPGSAALHANLGLALRAAGRLPEALASFRRSLGLAPNIAETHSNLGNALLEQGDVDAAAESFARAVALNPELAAAQANLGDARWAQGRLKEAEACHLNVLSLQPDNADTLKTLALLALALGDVGKAVRRILQALAADDSPRCHRIFGDIIPSLRWDADDPQLRHVLTRAIAEAWTRPSVLAATANELIKLRLKAGGRLETDEMLQALLRATPNSDIKLEAALTQARRALLARASADQEEPDPEFAAALAQQCFINEYVFCLEPQEAAEVETLQARITAALAAGQTVPEGQLVALACYRPLGALPQADRITATSERLAALLKQQRDEPAEEQRLAATVPVLTPIEDDVSQKVRGQYEANPYPRWVRLTEAVTPLRLSAYLSSRFPFAGLPQAHVPEKPDTLLAGCGTGQYALELSRQFMLGDVVAIDLSRASLAHAARKAKEAGVTQVRFGQGDILKVAALGRRFGLIESSGVLHHMADPFAGWQALVDCLEPDGLMLVAFYSAAARRAIAQTRDWIVTQGFAATPDGIRACRAELMREDSQGRLRTILTSPDFFSTSACRDLLFHVQEHNLSLEEIAGFLQEQGLAFIGFEVAEPIIAAYRARFPDDPRAVNLANWSRFETENPETFAAMYQFWVQKRVSP
jgi:tetratricopeptide (TPR) repeat protein/SAM-dependent methyltransferase